MKTLSELKHGDKVAYEKPFPSKSRQVIAVNRLTKTQILAGEMRFRLSDGKEIGSPVGWRGAGRIRVAEETEIIRIQGEARHRDLVAQSLKENWSKWPLEALEEVEAIRQRINKPA